MLLTGGVHGDEYEGQIAISRLARRLDAQSARGKVFMLPAVVLPAALAGTLHFIEERARQPQPIEFPIDGYVWMAPGSGRARKSDVVAVIMQDFVTA